MGDSRRTPRISRPDCRFRDGAFLDIHHQAVILPDEANIELLFRLVPLCADHDPIAVTVGLGGRGMMGLTRAPENPPTRSNTSAHLLLLQRHLGGVGDMLVLAAAAQSPKVAAARSHPVERGPDHPQQAGARKALPHLRDLRLHLLAGQHKGNEKDKIAYPPNTFTSEGDVRDRGP